MDLRITLFFFLLSLREGLSLWCYQCTSATPGCTTPFNWRGVGWLGSECPDNDDICIKLIERKGDMAKAKPIGNCSLLKGIVDSNGIIGIRGNRTTSPVKMVASRIFPVIFLMTKRVPLHNQGGPIFNRRLCGDIPAHEVVTRDCLSNFKAFRTDIPADTYEGCRSAAKDVLLANYVNNTVKELDVKRDHYDQTIWCFCNLDHRCNSGHTLVSWLLAPLASALIVTYFNI